jgi:hypothetical protein
VVTLVTESYGPVEAQVRADIVALGDLDGIQPSLAQTAYTLARALDDGAGMATAAVARELRATLEQIVEVGDDGGAAASLYEQLSRPDVSPTVVDAAKPRPAKPRRPRGGGSGATG